MKVTINNPVPIQPPKTIDIIGLSPETADRLMALVGVVAGVPVRGEWTDLYEGLKMVLGKGIYDLSSYKVKTPSGDYVNSVFVVPR